MDENEKKIRIIVLAKAAPVLFLLLIPFIALLRGIFSEKVDPMDNSINKTRELVETFDVVDTARNGFRITYATTNNVTTERLNEIRSRKPIQESFASLRYEVPRHFGNNMLYTDIYDFADAALRYDVDKDIVIHCIFITGKAKVALYEAPNPAIPNSADWISPLTEQGVQWINHNDIYYCDRQGTRKYRYWKCHSIYSVSFTDERFIHFSEDDRIY